jgi:hypothetical protein
MASSAALTESHDVGHALGAAAAAALLMAADEVGLVLRAALHVEHADALGRMQLVGAEAKEIDAQLTARRA